MSISFDDLAVQSFFQSLRLEGLQPGTIASYRRLLQQFLAGLPPEVGSLSDVQLSHLVTFVKRQKERGLSSSTTSNMAVSLRRFFAYLAAEKSIPMNPARNLPIPQVGKRLPKALSEEDVVSLLCALKDSSLEERRDELMICLLYGTGVRVSELVHLKVENIDLEDEAVRVIGKGNKERRIYLKPMLTKMIQDYLAETKVTAFLFPGKVADHISTSEVTRRLKEYARQAGLTQKVTPHTLRHSVAVHYLMARAPLSFVQGLLGHDSLATTGKYLLLADPEMERIALSVETAVDGDMMLKTKTALDEENAHLTPEHMGIR